MDIQKLLHPENLSDEELKSILRLYFIPVPEDMSRCSVIELFRKVAVPLPQRQAKLSQTEQNSRFEVEFSNAYNKREQIRNVPDYDVSKKLKPNQEFMNLLKNQLSDVRISNSNDNRRSVSENLHNPNFLKRRISAQLPYDRCKQPRIFEVTC